MKKWNFILLAGVLWLAAVGGFVACSDDDDDSANDDDVANDDDTDDDDDDVTDDDDDDDDIANDDDDPPTECDQGEKPAHARAAQEPAEGDLKAGVGVSFVTGPVGVSMAGYGGRKVVINSPWKFSLNGSRGFYGYQSVKAMVLEVEGELLVLMKIPTMSSEAMLVERTIDKVMEATGVDLTGRILTGATHSHHTNARYWGLPPGLGAVGADEFDPEVTDLLAGAFAEAVQRGLEDLAPAQWGVATHENWDPDSRVHRDRRGENNPTYGKDSRLVLLAVQRPDGTPMAAIFNFGMHGTLFDSDNELLTEDAPGAVELKFEEYFFQQEGQPIFGMFIQSGGGDASPGDGVRNGYPPPPRAESVGVYAAPRIYDLYQSIEWKDTAALAVRSRRIDLRYEWMGYPENGEFQKPDGSAYCWGGWQCSAPGVEVDDSAPETSNEGHPKECVDIGDLITALQAGVPDGQVHQAYMTTARLDDFYIITLPGEPAASTIQYARESAAQHDNVGELMVFGYSQDHFLYLLHPDDWAQGGYEADMTLWGPYFSKYLVDRQMELVDDLANGFAGPVWYEESPNLSPWEEYEPRALEISDGGPGTIDIPTEAEYKRTQRVRFGWIGGDASIGSPHVVIQQQNPDDSWVNHLTPSGFKEIVIDSRVIPYESGDVAVPGHTVAPAPLDNSRYHFITHYNPDPPPNGVIEERRTHHWFVDFEIPIDCPAGTYRLDVWGLYWDGESVKEYSLLSDPFTVANAEGLSADTALDGTMLTLKLKSPPTVYQKVETYPITGWRLMDPWAAPSDPAAVRAPLTVAVLLDGVQQGDALGLTPDADGNVTIDLSTLGVDPNAGVVSVQVHLSHDIIPAPTEFVVTP